MASEFKTSIVLDLVDRLTSPLRRITQSMRGIAQRAGFDGLRQSARRVQVALGGVIKQSVALVKGFALAGGAALGLGWAVTRMVGGVATLGNEIKIASERLGVGAGWLQEWQYAAAQFGVGNDALIDGLKELGLRTDEFVMTGSGAASESFQRLGITVKDLRATAGDTEKLLDLVQSRLGKIENDAARQRIFDELFGGSGGEQLVAMLSQSREELDKLRQAARDNGAVLSDEDIEQSRLYVRQMHELRTAMTSIQRIVMVSLLPAVNGWLTKLRELSQAHRQAITTEILNRLKQLWTILQTIGRGLDWLSDLVGGVSNLVMILSGMLATKLVLSLGIAIFQFALLAKQVALTALAMGGGAVKAIVAFSGAMMGLALRAVPAAIVGIRALSLALLTTPVGWIITAIAAIAGGVYLIYRNWDSIAEWFSGMWDQVKAFFNRGTGEILADLATFTPATLLLKAIDAVFELFGARPLSEMGREWIGGLWDGIKERFNQLLTWVRQQVQMLSDLMPDWVKEKMGISVAPAAAAGVSAASLGAPVLGNRPSPLAPMKADVGGELRIKIDSEGRARVASMNTRGGLDYSVESGTLGLVP